MARESKTKISSYRAQTLKALDALYEDNVRSYSVTEITNKVIELRIQENDALPDNDPNKQYGLSWETLFKNTEPNVSKVLRAMQGDLVFKSPGHKGLYAKRNHKDLRELILREVCFTSPEVFPFSKTAFLISVTEETFDRASELFHEYIGDRCFDIVPFSNYMMILVRPQKSVPPKEKDSENSQKETQKSTLIKEILDITKTGYELRDDVATRLATGDPFTKQRKQQSKETKKGTKPQKGQKKKATAKKKAKVAAKEETSP